jgi:hypothetical protein
VAEALAGFRPARRTAVEDVPLADALHRVPAGAVPATGPLPGFARSTVDGYAVRAADTYGASEALPSYLDLLGAVRMGEEPTVAVRPGGAVGMPTGGVLPEGADAVVMVENTAETMPGTIEVTRPVAPGSGIVRADEDVAAGAALVPGERPLCAPISDCSPRPASPRSRCTRGHGFRSSPPATRWCRRTRRAGRAEARLREVIDEAGLVVVSWPAAPPLVAGADPRRRLPRRARAGHRTGRGFGGRGQPLPLNVSRSRRPGRTATVRTAPCR